MKEKFSLIVGANSFLGSYLARLLHNENQKIIGVYNSNINKIDASLFERILPYAAVTDRKEEISTIYFLNSYIPYGKMNEPSEKFYLQNVAPVEQISALYPDAKMVLASSVSVYGASSNAITEAAVPTPETLYGLSKLQAEEIIQQQKHFSIVRFSSIYGKGMTDKTMLPALIKNARQTGLITLYGDGSRTQNYIHACDAALFLMQAAKTTTNEIYLGTAAQSFSNLEVATIIQNNLKDVEIAFQGEDSAKSFSYDNTTTLHKLNYTFGYNLEKGLEELIDSTDE